jgi:hypothetical protein
MIPAANPTDGNGGNLKRTGVLLVAVAIAMLAGGTIVVAATHYETTINERGHSQSADGEHELFFGDLHTNTRCRHGREMKLVRENENGSRTWLDRTRTSRRGAWALKGKVAGAAVLFIKVRKDKRNHATIVCGADSIVPGA